MIGFIGEIACKIDSKGRLTVPAKFLKQMPVAFSDRFVITMGIDRNLVLRSMPVWENYVTTLQGLNQFNEKNRRFMSRFMRGADELFLDSSKRILISKRLMEYAGLKKEIVLLGKVDSIEIWDVDMFDSYLDIDPETFSELADEVMGQKEMNSPSGNDSSQSYPPILGPQSPKGF